MSEELKPCPFCGGEAYIRILMGSKYIDCHHSKECAMMTNSWLISSKPLKKQIKAWNRRANDGKVN